MTYQIASIDAKDLDKIKKIPNQDRILQVTGSKLNPFIAYEIIKRETEGFTKEDARAAEADALYTELLRLNGIDPGSQKKPSKKKDNDGQTNILRVREQERARKLRILELELQL
jgi:hypothetical protein